MSRIPRVCQNSCRCGAEVVDIKLDKCTYRCRQKNRFITHPICTDCKAKCKSCYVPVCKHCLHEGQCFYCSGKSVCCTDCKKRRLAYAAERAAAKRNN